MAIPSGYTVLKLPQWILFIRIAQAVVALVIFGLVCYGEIIVSFDAENLTLFTALVTLLILVYTLGSEFFLQQIYNFWAILALECILVLFWLVSFALLASEVNSSTGVRYMAYSCFYTYCYKRSLSLVRTADTFYNAMAAAAGLGGLEFALFVITLVVVSIYVHRERVGGARADPADPANLTAPEITQAAPRSTTHPHPHPRDLEEEMIENENRRTSVQQEQVHPQPEGHDTSHVEHIEQGGEIVEGHDDRGARQHFNIEV